MQESLTDELERGDNCLYPSSLEAVVKDWSLPVDSEALRAPPQIRDAPAIHSNPLVDETNKNADFSSQDIFGQEQEERSASVNSFSDLYQYCVDAIQYLLW